MLVPTAQAVSETTGECSAGALVQFLFTREDHVGDEEYQLQVQMEDPIAFAAKTSDLDTMQANQALREPDHKELIAAMENEVMAHHNKFPLHHVNQDAPANANYIYIYMTCITL